MRITGRELRQLIRETLMQEVPIVFGPDDSATDYRTPPLDPEDRRIGAKKMGSIGRRRLRKPEGRAEARALFLNTPDNWAIVTLDNVSFAEDYLDSDQFKLWIAQQRFPKETRILVVGGQPYKGDFTSTRWAVAHDIIGHTIHNWVATMITSSGGFADMSEEAHRARGIVAAAILKQLPPQKRPGKTGDEIPDALAAVFFGEVDLERARQDAHFVVDRSGDPDLHRDVDWALDAYRDGVPQWIASIPVDKPTPVYPF
jgi:hypothetical protein